MLWQAYAPPGLMAPFDKYTRENTHDHEKPAIIVIITEWVTVILYCKLIPDMVAMKLPVQCCISAPALRAHTLLACSRDRCWPWLLCLSKEGKAVTTTVKKQASKLKCVKALGRVWSLCFAKHCFIIP